MPSAFQRQRYLIDYSLMALGRRPGKHLGLLAVYTLIVAVLASVMLFSESLRGEARLLLAGAPEVVLQRLEAGRHALMPASYLARIEGLRGVSGVRGRLWGYHYDPFIGANYTLMVPPSDAPLPGTLAIGAGLARSRGLEVGDLLSLRAANGEPYGLKVAARLDTESELLSTDLVLLSEQDFRAFFGIPADHYTDLVLQVRNPREVHTVKEKLNLVFPDSRPILREEVLRTYDAVFGWRQGVVFVILLGSVLAFVILAWDKASGLSAEERREIGVLKAVGWETADIMRMKFWEGAVISLSAFLLGYLLAYLHVFHAGAVLFAPVLKGWAVLYPDFAPLPSVDGLQLATLFFFTVFPYTLATIVPIWRVATRDPDAVMR